MHRRIVYAVVVCLLISIAFVGCAKKEEPAGKYTVTPKKEVPQVKTPQATQPSEEAPRPVPSQKPISEERVLFSFEGTTDGFEIPFWTLEKEDHVADSIESTQEFASEGNASLKVNCDFPGKSWTAALVELEQYLDFSPYREVAVDIYIPPDAPLGLRAKLILTVGDDWRFTEMTRTIPLVPGKWVKVSGNIEPGSYDWKRTVPDESFRQDVRKIVVRIESNRVPVYKGPVYIDNIRIGK